MIVRDRTDLPEPDSPTMPSVLPRSSVNETSVTARTSPRGERNDVDTFRTSSSGPEPGTPLGAGADEHLLASSQDALPEGEAPADHVAEVVERQHREEQHDGREHHDVG